MDDTTTEDIDEFDPGVQDRISTPQKIALEAARQIQILLIKGRYDSARRIIGELERRAAFENSKKPLGIEQRLDLPIAGSTLEVRLINLLEDNGILTIRDLVGKRPTELAEIPGMGEKYVLDVINHVKKLLDE